MEKVAVTRAYLETLSYAELVNIADEDGIDVPENFDRFFLIEEILEVKEELTKSSADDMIISDDEIITAERDFVPKAYNSTDIEIVLRNPAWAFVYWNISDSDRSSLDKAFVSQMMVRVNSFSYKEQEKPDEFFDIQISKSDSGQYVLLPAGKPFFRIDLLFNIDGIIDILASSKVLTMPKGSQRFSHLQLEAMDSMSPVMELSGMKNLLLEHYKNHRESFS